MKHFYNITLFLCMLLMTSMQAQTFDFSVSFVGTNSSTNNYQMALIATPSSSVTNGVTADMGAGFYVPSGFTIGNFVAGDSGIPTSDWSSTALGSNASGDAFFLSRVETGGSSTILNGAGPFELVLFDVIANPNPATGQIIFVENGDPVFMTLFVQNYININLGGGTVDAYLQNDPTVNNVQFSTLGVEEELLSDTPISIYPNPTSQFINISTDASINSIELFDLLGKRVLKTKEKKQIAINQFPAGLYLLKVYSKNGSITKKIIIE